MRSEYSAMQGLSDSKEEIIKGCIADRNAATRLNEQLEKQRKNELFWSRVLKTIATLIVVSTLIKIAG